MASIRLSLRGKIEATCEDADYFLSEQFALYLEPLLVMGVYPSDHGIKSVIEKMVENCAESDAKAEAASIAKDDAAPTTSEQDLLFDFNFISSAKKLNS